MNPSVEKAVLTPRRSYRRSACPLQPQSAFGRALVALMKRKGWDRADLSRATGVAWSTIDRWMRGAVPHQRNVEWCAAKLKVSVAELGGAPQPSLLEGLPKPISLLPLISELNPFSLEPDCEPQPSVILESNPRQPEPRGACRFPGMTELAQRKGVDRSSLYRFLTGQREAPLLAKDPEVIAFKERCEGLASAMETAGASPKAEWIERIRFALRCLRVEQREIAKRLGVHEVTVSRWLGGRKCPPRPATFELMCRVLELPIEWVLRGERDEENRALLLKRGVCPLLAPAS